MIERLRARIAELNSQIQAINVKAEARGDGKLLASEQRAYQDLAAERGTVEARVRQLEDEQTRRSAEAEALSRLGVRHDSAGQVRQHFGAGADTVYARGSGYSYFADLASLLQPATPGAYEAQQRLNQHAEMIERVGSDLPAAFRSSPLKRGAHVETRVNPNRTDGQGGFFVPPLWIVDEWVALLRAGRALADRTHRLDLPTGTDSVNFPKVNTGTTTAIQAADAGGVSSTDLTDTSVSASVRTIAGQQDVALQLIEQSPINFDEVVFADLAADYNQKLDLQVISGSNASGQMKGLLTLAGTNAVTYTDATPTLPELWVPLMQSLSLIAKLRFQSPDTIGLHPSLWYWMCSQLDTTGRPLIAPSAGAMNAISVLNATAGAEGVVGSIGNVDIVADANMPTNLGAGSNETRIIAGRYTDAFLMEGALRTRAIPEVLSGTLQVRLQVYNYAAFLPDRYPTAFSVVSGTGLIPAAGF